MNYPTTPIDEARFWIKVCVPEDASDPIPCWEWQGNRKTGTGYGLIWVGRRAMRAHRVMLQLCSGRPVPSALFGCHACDNPCCVSPHHIFLGTRRDNHDDMRTKGRGFVPPKSSARRGDTHPKAKLTRKQVQTILAALAKGVAGRTLARRFGIADSRISEIRHGRAWV